jgi:hypothetical protein
MVIEGAHPFEGQETPFLPRGGIPAGDTGDIDEKGKDDIAGKPGKNGPDKLDKFAGCEVGQGRSYPYYKCFLKKILPGGRFPRNFKGKS